MQISREVERADRQYADHLEALIDESGTESFPASDPPAVHPERSPVLTNVPAGLEPAGKP